MVPPAVVPPSLMPAAAQPAPTAPAPPFVARQPSEASSFGIGGGSADWGNLENAELLDSFFEEGDSQ